MADNEGQGRVNEEQNQEDQTQELTTLPASPISTDSHEETSVTPPSDEPTKAPQTDQPEETRTAIHSYSDLPRLIEHKYSHWDTLRSFSLQTLLWLQFFWTLLSHAGSVTQTVSRGVIRTLQKQVYVFFQGSPFPYRVQDYTLSGPGVPPIEWYYDADKKLFLSSSVYNTTTEYETNHFEWLSGQIKYNDLLLQDISDYLQQAKWAGGAPPSAAVLVSAWSLHSGTVLHLSEGLRLHTINQDASESAIPIRG
jgi:hypothetical protein